MMKPLRVMCVCGGATVKNSPPASLAAFITPHYHYGMVTKPSIAHKHEGLFSNFIYLEKLFFLNVAPAVSGNHCVGQA